ncbi:hypothetical protein AURANDRAFT_35077, partial [Aureococcus anophagefferens]
MLRHWRQEVDLALSEGRIETNLGFGQTPLDIACLSGYDYGVRKLLDAGANIHKRTHQGETFLQWQSPLHVAAALGHAKIVSMLINEGADVDASDGGMSPTPLFYAAGAGHVAVVKTLLAHGALLTWEDPLQDGATALHVAAALGHAKIVSMLLNEGADVDA